MSLYKQELRAWLKRTGGKGRRDLRGNFTTPHGGMDTDPGLHGDNLYDKGQRERADAVPDAATYVRTHDFSLRECNVARQGARLVREYRRVHDLQDIPSQGYEGDTLLGTWDKYRKWKPGFVDRKLPDLSERRRVMVAVAALKFAKQRGVTIGQRRGEYDACPDCGEPKRTQSERCLSCWREEQVA